MYGMSAERDQIHRAFLDACKHESLEKIIDLLKSDIYIPYSNYRCFMIAAQKNDVPLFNILINYFESSSSYNQTALEEIYDRSFLWANYYDSFEVAQYIVIDKNILISAHNDMSQKFKNLIDLKKLNKKLNKKKDKLDKEKNNSVKSKI